MNYPHVRTGSMLSKGELRTLMELNKAMQTRGMQPNGPFQPVGPTPQSPKPVRREVTTPAKQPVPTMRQRAALKAVIERGGWQGKVGKHHLDALWRRLPDLGLEHDAASNSIRPVQAAPLTGGRPRTKRATDTATRGLVVQRNMKEGHEVMYTQATGERATGSIVGWGRHGATVRSSDGQAIAVPFSVMVRVTPPPEQVEATITKPKPKPKKKAKKSQSFDDMLKSAETRAPEVLS